MSNITLSSRLTIFFIFVVILVITTLSGIEFYLFGEKIEKQIEHNLLDIADHKADDIKNILLIERSNIIAILSSPIIINAESDRRIDVELQKIKEAYNIQGDLYIADYNDIIISSTQHDVTYKQMPEEWKVKKDYSIKSKHEVSFINEPIIAHIAVINNNELKRKNHLIMTHEWNDIAKLLVSNETNYAIRNNNEENVDFYTKDATKKISINNELKIQSLWDFNDRHYLGAISKQVSLNDFIFQIAAFIPTKTAQEPLVELAKNLLVAASIVTIPMFVFVGLLSRRLMMPIKKLTSTIRIIQESDDLSIQLKVLGRDEVADLGNAFNRMTAQLNVLFNKFKKVEKELEDLNVNLENQVTDRTAQLQDTLNKLTSAQTQLVQSEKMASLGQLVAGIAHEINNPIGAIYANMPPLEDYITDIKNTVEFAKSCADDNGLIKLNEYMETNDFLYVIDDLNQLLTSQKQAADRIRNIVMSLRNFSRLDQGEVKSVLLEDGLDSTLQMLTHNYKGRIEIQKHYRLNEIVECFAGELNQVFMNILANAIQAIPDKGMIAIKTKKENNNAVIYISDTGIGMPENVCEKIFDPFFTTKEIGEGTGLGLSISYGIIEKHNGSIIVKSKVNRGTRFTITIPLRLYKED